MITRKNQFRYSIVVITVAKRELKVKVSHSHES